MSLILILWTVQGVTEPGFCEYGFAKKTTHVLYYVEVLIEIGPYSGDIAVNNAKHSHKQ